MGTSRRFDAPVKVRRLPDFLLCCADLVCMQDHGTLRADSGSKGFLARCRFSKSKQITDKERSCSFGDRCAI